MKTTESDCQALRNELLHAISECVDAKRALTLRVKAMTENLPEFAKHEEARANVKRLHAMLNRMENTTAQRVKGLQNWKLCLAWNTLTSPSKMRTENAHKLASNAARAVMAEIKNRGFRFEELSNGAIFTK
jgi:exonuclease VII large subunit